MDLDDEAEHFVRACEGGDLRAVNKVLRRGRSGRNTGRSGGGGGGGGGPGAGEAADRPAWAHWVTEAAEGGLHAACRTGRAKVVEALLKAGAPVEGHAVTGNWGLHVAALHGQVGCVKTLLEHGPSEQLTARNAFGETALMLAARAGKKQVVKVLLSAARKQGSAVNEELVRQVSHVGETALDVAEDFGRSGVALLLSRQESQLVLVQRRRHR